MKNEAWTKEEEKILKDKYAQFGSVIVKELLPHRSKSSIRNKAAYLGIKGPYCDHAKKKKVSKRDYEIESKIIEDFG